MDQGNIVQFPTSHTRGELVNKYLLVISILSHEYPGITLRQLHLLSTIYIRGMLRVGILAQAGKIGLKELYADLGVLERLGLITLGPDKLRHTAYHTTAGTKMLGDIMRQVCQS